MRANELELLRASGVEPCLLMDNGGKTGRLPFSEAALALRTSINMFPNWYFADPINQRGLTEYGAGYSIDRWILQSITNGKLVLQSGYVTVFAQHNDGLCFRAEESDLLLGETYTVSVLTYDNQLLTYTFVLSKTGTIYNYTGREWSLYVGFNNGMYTIYPIIAYGKATQISIDVVAVKLEPGSISTLVHKEGDTWVLNDPPPDKALGLLKCKRYYRHFDNITFVLGEIWGSVYQSASMTYEPMRANPTVDIGSGTIANIGELAAGTFGIYASRDELRCYVKQDAMPGTNLTGKYLTLRNVELNAEL